MDSVLIPEQLFGKEQLATLRAVEPTGWYPIAILLDALEFLDRRLGPDSIRTVGMSLFRRSHEAAVRAKFTSAFDLLHAFDRIYRTANRGSDIGGWKVAAFGRGSALLEKTTPHHCTMEEGLLDAALRAVNAPSRVTQRQCFRRGATHCVFEIGCHLIDHRWAGKTTI